MIVSDDPFEVRHFTWSTTGPGPYHVLKVDCVPTFSERIVPPAGEDNAFDVQHYRRRVEISVSPTGRSVRVFVDGKEVPQ